MRYWKVIESHADHLIKDKIYVSDDDSEHLKGDNDYNYGNRSIDSGWFCTEFKEVTEDDYLKQELLYGEEKEESLEQNSAVHPKHYQLCSIECIEAILMSYGGQVVYDFCMCNAFKYIWRHKNKNGIEDIEKARYYVDKAICIAQEYEIKSEEASDIDIVLKRLESGD